MLVTKDTDFNPDNSAKDLSFIYVLTEPGGSPGNYATVRYVGKTQKDPRERLRVHFSKHRIEKNHKSNWILKLLEMGLKPEMHVIAVVPMRIDSIAERNVIKLYKNLGSDLTNLTEGGDGLCNPSDEVRRKISLAKLGMKHTEEAKEKIRTAGIGRRHSEKTKAKMSAIKTGKRHSEETKAKLSALKAGIKQSEETKTKRSKSMKIARKRDGYAEIMRSRMLGSLNPMYGRKLVGRMNGFYGKTHTDEVRKKMSESHKGKPLSEEHRRKSAEAQRARRLREKLNADHEI